MDTLAYVGAAYAVVLVTLAGYAGVLARRERRLRQALASGAAAAARRGG